MSADNVYGPIVTRRRIAVALQQHVFAHFPGYLRDVQREEGWADTYPDVADWPPVFQAHRFTASENTVVNLPENALPALLVASPGLRGEPQIHSEDKQMEGTWVFGLHALVSGIDEDSTDRMVGEHTAALRALCAQQRMVGDGFAEIMAVSDEAYDPLPDHASRTLAAGTVTVLLVVDEMVHAAKGPIEPPADPDVDPGGLVEIEEATVTVDKL